MNYIKEMNAFYDWLEINELSASAVNLWYALMHINNKAGWAETFTVAESVLSVKTQLNGRTVRSARNELKQKGRIDFKSRTGGRPPIYTIISFENLATEINSVVNVRDSVRENVRDSVRENVRDSVRENVTLNKLNETKLNNKEKEDNVFVFFQENGFGTISSHIKDQIDVWMDDASFDEPESIILHAMKLAVENNARNWAYVNRILLDWANRNLKTLSGVKAHQEQYWQSRQAQAKQSTYTKPVKKEKVPDYIANQEQKYHAGQALKVEADQETSKRVDELLKKLGEA